MTTLPTPSASIRRGRVPTGIPGFDVVAGGGLPAGRSTLVAGTSGSGKTVFALQFLAAGAGAPGENGVLVTFEERPVDLFANVESFGWDLAGMVAAGHLAVVDATPEDDVVEVGPYDFGGLMERIEHALAAVGARRLVIDAIDAAFAQFRDELAVRRELARVVRRLRELDVTALMTTERVEEYGGVARRGVEEFVSDDVVILRNALDDHNRRRTVEVLKLRGFPHNKGEYAFVIAPRRGIEIVPTSGIESERVASDQHVSLGNPQLDDMCAGGPYRDSLVLVSGATGVGKSLMGVQFARAGLEAGERVILFSFEESPSQIIRNATSWGIDLETPRRRGDLLIVSRFPDRMGLEDLLVTMSDDIERHVPQRVVIDSVTALEHNADRRAFRDFVVGTAAQLKARGVATMMITTPPELMGARVVSGIELSTLTDAIILLRYVEIEGDLRRALMVLKMRGVAHDRTLREFDIRDDGMHVLAPLRGVDAVLGGTARALGAPADHRAAP